MDRILRAVPFAMTVVLLALAIVGMRWAIRCPGRSRPAAASLARVVSGADRREQPVALAAPRLLPTENSPSDLQPVTAPARVVFTAGFPEGIENGAVSSSSNERSENGAVSSSSNEGLENGAVSSSSNDNRNSLAPFTGPELTFSPEATKSVRATEPPAVETLSEIPVAEAWPAADQPEPDDAANPELRLLGNGSGVESNDRILAETAVGSVEEEGSGDSAKANASPLPTAEVVNARSVQLERVAQQADRQVRHGIELAGRGAHFAARAEFIGALRLVAEGLDSEQHSSMHGEALAAALTALKEAEDFLPLGSRLEADLDLPGIIGMHSTPVLKGEASHRTPMIALRCYLTYAQEHFAVAAGREVAGSMALYAMGKLQNASARNKRSAVTATESRAVVFYQAALMVYPKNYMAANDLGVLLAQCGNNADARVMLEHSVSLSRQPTSWRNLAVVYRQLGQSSLAERASQQATRLRQAELAKRQAASPASSPVQWVDTQAFAQTSPEGANASVAASSPIRASGMPPRPPAAAMNRPGVERTGPGVARSVGTPGNSAWGTAPTAGYSRAGPAGRPTSDTYGPAPTPAAANRMTWGAAPYQR